MLNPLNTIIGNAKRFMTYEIVHRLKAASENVILRTLSGDITNSEKKKGQLHRVFEESFDAKKCVTPEFIYQKLDYIHHNPTKGKWMLAKDFLKYEHSSALLFYEGGKCQYEKLMRIEEAI